MVINHLLSGMIPQDRPIACTVSIRAPGLSRCFGGLKDETFANKPPSFGVYVPGSKLPLVPYNRG